MKVSNRAVLKIMLAWRLIGLAVGCSLFLLTSASRGQPTATSIKTPSIFNLPLEPINEDSSTVTEAVLLTTAVQNTGPGNTMELVGALQAFLDEHSTSAWAPALRANLGEYYFHEGQYTKALAALELAWGATKQANAGPGRRVADHALTTWTSILIGMGRVEEYEAVMADAAGRRPAGGALLQKFLRSHEAYLLLKRNPSASYRCGGLVLNELAARMLGRKLRPSDFASLYEEANLLEACSFNSLSQIAKTEQWSLTGLQRPDGTETLIVPSIMHLKQGHYIALLQQQPDRVLAYDPMFGIRYFTIAALNEETSGRFLASSAQVPTGWRLLTDTEMRTTLGRSQWFNGFPDNPDGLCCDCAPGMGGGPGPRNGGMCSARSCGGGGLISGGTSALGMPEWKVTEPNINLWIHDVPISCQSAYGPPVNFEIVFKQHDPTPKRQDCPTLGPTGWNCTWISFLDLNEYLRYGTVIHAYLPGGVKLDYYPPNGQNTAYEYVYNSRITINGDGTYTIDYPDGKQYFYSQSWNSGQLCYMTRLVDQQGFWIQLNYVQINNGIRLDTVADQTGQMVYTVQYDSSDPAWPNLISGVTDRFGRSAQILYIPDTYGNHCPHQIIDAAALVSTLTYDANEWPQTLTTPYGTNVFAYQNNIYAGFRWVSVTEPNGGKQVFLYNADCTYLWSGQTWMPQYFPANTVPGNLPAGTQLDTVEWYRNSFYWDQRQSVGLPDDVTLLTAAQMNKGRMRHWLDDSQFHYGTPTLTLSVEVGASTNDDGSTIGQITWYDHAGKSAPDVIGSQIQPSLIARKMSDASTWYESCLRNSFGFTTSRTTTYGTGNPAPTRTYSYVYAANEQDLTAVYRPGTELVSSYVYNTRHQVITNITWADAVTGYTNFWIYDSQGRLQTEGKAGGLTRTHTYDAWSGAYPGYLSQIDEQPTAATQSFTWVNGNVSVETDARGLRRTFTRDGLNRVTQIAFPAHDGIPATTEQYVYALAPGQGFNNTLASIPVVDLTGKKDRLDKWTYYGLDRLRRLTSITDPLNHTTSYTFCGCGGVQTITDARNKTTTFSYNNAGWKTAVLYADNTSESYGYDLLGRLTSRSDALGSKIIGYNNQGLRTSISSSYGTEWLAVYDINDYPQNETDERGVTASKTFDRLGRMITRSIPGQSGEMFMYSPLGLTNYIGPNSKSTSYAYDPAGRKVSETTPKREQTLFTNSPAGDLLSLTDGRGKTTIWTYDSEGLLRQKAYHGQTFANIEYSYDANQRLVWRKFWSSPTANKQTNYEYDDAGNLTSIDYPTSPDVSFTYNEVNQKQTMTTAGLGTITYSYTDGEELASEGGLWANDTINYYYDASVPALRTNLTLSEPTGNWSQTYFYDGIHRLHTLSSPAGAFTYTYSAGTTLWTNLGLPSNASITNKFDSAARLLFTCYRNSSGAFLNWLSYYYNGAGQRRQQTLMGGSYTVYDYDDDGQLNSSLGYTSTGNPIPNEQLGFLYDPGFNLTNRSANGANEVYTVDNWNELTTTPGGSACGYDANGNMVSRGPSSLHTGYQYDDENRLIVVTNGPSGGLGPMAPTPTGGWKAEFSYDGLGRLRVRRDYYATSTGYYLTNTTCYLYDGNRVIQERGSANGPLVSYTRGLDLAGTLEAAGGIGGLLARSDGYSGGSWSSHNFYHADALGNVVYMANFSQATVAQYKYDPFGRLLSSSGTLANANLLRFSSKEFHVNSGLYYYLYRFYEPNLERWLNRDPICDVASPSIRFLRGKLGRAAGAAEVVEGPNLYRLGRNKPTIAVDFWGLACGADDLPWYIPGSDPTVPDQPFGFDFSGACNNHDNCYSTCGADKSDCDKRFLKDMQNKCHSYQPALANPDFCLLLAYIYYQAVNHSGGGAYKDAQNEACGRSCPFAPWAPSGDIPGMNQPYLN